MAAVHLLDDRFQHRVASAGGVPLVRGPVDDSMCRHVVESGRAIYTSDAASEPVFRGSPFTSGPDPVRLYYSTPVRVSDGTVIGTLCVFGTKVGALDTSQRDRLDDLAAQAGAHLEISGLSRELVHLASHDPLTEVANRRLLSERLALALDDPTRRSHEPALLLVDLDGFKAVNDRLGHHVGDQVLQSTARRLLATVRAMDLVARLGGDELAVLVEGPRLRAAGPCRRRHVLAQGAARPTRPALTDGAPARHPPR
jgi:GGDEF domain-containing protein